MVFHGCDCPPPPGDYVVFSASATSYPAKSHELRLRQNAPQLVEGRVVRLEEVAGGKSLVAVTVVVAAAAAAAAVGAHGAPSPLEEVVEDVVTCTMVAVEAGVCPLQVEVEGGIC